ncbi:MAG: hypothetical protein Q8K69_02130 [Bacteroidota bacterium]|nr:hypothetical protein [Bacteroidota bacterium]MDP3434164.1 hypothetical protein [Bacteroidota bacterium]
MWSYFAERFFIWTIRNQFYRFENMYAGATNNGICPLNNAVWGNANINGEIWDLCPLGATMKNLDGRTTNGHVDNYWINYESIEPDPYITNGWQQHENKDCTGDYMISGFTTLYANNFRVSWKFNWFYVCQLQAGN